MPRSIIVLLLLIVSGHSCVFPDSIREYENDEAYYNPRKEKFGTPDYKKDTTGKEEDYYKPFQKLIPKNSKPLLQNYYYPSPYWYSYPSQHTIYSSPPALNYGSQTQDQNTTNYPRPSSGSSSSGSVNRVNPKNPAGLNRRNPD